MSDQPGMGRRVAPSLVALAAVAVPLARALADPESGAAGGAAVAAFIVLGATVSGTLAAALFALKYRSLAANLGVFCVGLVALIPAALWFSGVQAERRHQSAERLVAMIEAHRSRLNALPKTLLEVGPEAAALEGPGTSPYPPRGFRYIRFEEGQGYSVQYLGTASYAFIYNAVTRTWEKRDLH